MRLLIGILVLCVSSCGLKYQVVQELDSNKYHLYNEKEGVAIIFTLDDLKINQYYKLKDINILKPESE